MLSFLAVSLLAAVAPRSALAQFSFNNNVTHLSGTWSSGSGSVSTGNGFCNPVKFSFKYPQNTGISWAFTEDGFFEQAEYRMTANATNPKCITGAVVWQHGTYEVLSNGSIIATPYTIDGRIQVQSPCAAQSNQINQFNATVYIPRWGIYTDPQRGPKLQLSQFDGALLAPMYRIADPPNMLPTETIMTNSTLLPDGTIITSDAAMKILRRSALIAVGTTASVAVGVFLVL